MGIQDADGACRARGSAYLGRGRRSPEEDSGLGRGRRGSRGSRTVEELSEWEDGGKGDPGDVVEVEVGELSSIELTGLGWLVAGEKDTDLGGGGWIQTR